MVHIHIKNGFVDEIVNRNERDVDVHIAQHVFVDFKLTKQKSRSLTLLTVGNEKQILIIFFFKVEKQLHFMHESMTK